jgi:iron complex transport system permease protein
LSTSLLKIQNLSLRCGQQEILQKIDFEIERGDCVALIGANGAGKSSLLRTILGLKRPTTGNVLWKGEDLEKKDARFRAQRMAYVPQTMKTDAHFRVREFVAQSLYHQQASSQQMETSDYARVDAVLAALQLSELADSFLPSLSGGEMQAALLAAAMVQDAELLILDEPSASLDPRRSAEFYSLLAAVQRQFGLTILIASHDLNLVAPLATRCIVLHEGKIIEDIHGFAKESTLKRAFGADFFVQSIEGRALYFTRVDTKRDAAVFPRLDCEKKTQKQRNFFPHFTLLALLSLVLAPSIGTTWISPADIVEGGAYQDIWLHLRLPRVLWGALAGASLALIGAAFQSLLQNPLATPYTLGLASGASLGAMFALQLGFSAFLGVPLLAFVGAMLVMFLVLGIARRLGMNDSVNLLLAGVAASLFCSSLSILVQAFAEPLTAQGMLRWQMGGLDIDGFEPLGIAALVLPALLLIMFQAQALNLIAVDSDLARSRGVRVGSVRGIVFVAASVACAGIVSISGPIAFVGLVVPHIMRRIVGGDNRKLFVHCILGGMLFLLWADALVRVLGRWQLLPVGVLTAMIGAPALVLILLKTRKRS